MFGWFACGVDCAIDWCDLIYALLCAVVVVYLMIVGALMLLIWTRLFA